MSYETDLTVGSMGTSSRRMITAFFDSRSDAEDAVERLVSAGISRDQIKMLAGNEGDRGGASVTQSSYGEGSGFWEALRDFFLPDEDRYTYAEGLRRGGYLVTVTATDASYEQALDILDDEGTIDIDERAAAWRSEGWTGHSGDTAPTSSVTGSTFSDTAAPPRYSAPADQDRDLSGDREVIPVAKEELHVGKRDVSHGRVRVRSYVVETPVSEDVTLREERVNVERRPVDRALSGDEALFQERTIELEERGEEAVIAKEALVKEELVIDKEVGERTETVSDTVRRTEVDIDDERIASDSTSDRSRRASFRR